MDKIEFFWSGFEPLFRIIIVGTLAYISIVIVLRIAGNRTLASMNVFDFIITVTLGSAYGRILTAKSVALSEAVMAFILLALLQYVVSVLESRSKFFKKLVTSQPKLLYHNGNFIEKNMRKERIGKDELVGATRKKGFKSLDEIEVVILESDGSFSVIEKTGANTKLTYKKLIDPEAENL